MTHDQDTEGPPDDGADGLWEPGTAGDEVRSIEQRLSRHRHRPQAWTVPEGLEQDVPGPDQDGDATAIDPQTTPRAEGALGRPWGGRESEQPGDRVPVWRAQGSRAVKTLSSLAAAAIVLFFLGDMLGWFGPGDGSDTRVQAAYMLEALEGAPEVQRRGVSHRGERLEVQVGDRLVCDAGSRAALRVSGAGMVRMEPGTDVRIDSAPAGGWRLYLERGQLSASIFAAPRLFQVGTPSGIAVDLGCVYTATVGEDGETILSVHGGQVSFETADRKVFVPDGARVVAWPGRGPGTPVWNDAPGPLMKAIARLDALASSPATDLDASGSRSAVEELDRITEVRHSLSLWHLLDHPHPQVARAALQRLSIVSPPPLAVDPDDIRARRPAAMTLWREDLEQGW